MKTAILFLFSLSLPLLAANPANSTAVLLDSGVPCLTVHDSAGGTDYPACFSVTGTNRVMAFFSPIFVPPNSSTTYTPCSNPCTVTFNRSWGWQYFWTGTANSGGTAIGSMSTNVSAYDRARNGATPCAPYAVGAFPQVEPAVITISPLPMPIEVVAQDCYATHFQLPLVSGHSFASHRAYVRVYSPGYNSNVRPDGKISLQFNGASWITLTNSVATGIDEMRFYGGIGSYAQVREFTVPVVDGTIGSGDTTVTVGARFNGTEGIGSGFRILSINILEANKTLTTISNVNSTHVSTAAATSNGYTTGDTVLIQNALGMYMRFNGLRVLTGQSTNAFTFTPCGTSTAGCTDPDISAGSTLSKPPTNRDTESWPGNAQMVMYAARCIIAKSAFTEAAMPSAAPGGANATRGGNLFRTGNASGTTGQFDQFVNPGLPWLNYTLHNAVCASCHLEDGRDLKIFNYSNASIKARSMFHGLAEQDGDDIAAYIRGISVTVPAKGRPWNSAFQPCPGMSTATPEEFFAGGGVDCVLTSGFADMLEYLAPGGDKSKWLWNARLETRDLPLMYQFGTMAQWWPVFYPPDAFPAFDFFNNDAYLRYRDNMDNMTANNFSSFATHHYGSMWNGDGAGFGGFRGMLFGVTPGNVSLQNNVPGQLPPSNMSTRIYSVEQYAFKAMMDVALTKQTFCFDGQRVAAVYGGSSTPNPDWPIACGIYDFVVFELGMHKMSFDGTSLDCPPCGRLHGLYDGTATTYRYQSNAAYDAQLMFASGNGHGYIFAPIDNNYYDAFHKDLGQDRPNGYHHTLAQIVTAQLGNQWADMAYHDGVSEHTTDWLGLITRPFTYDYRFTAAWFSTAELTTNATDQLHMINTLFASHTSAYWNNTFGFNTACCSASTVWAQGNISPGNAAAYTMTLYKVWGVDATEPGATELATYKTFWESISLFSGHNFTNDINAATDGLPCTVGGAPTYGFSTGPKFYKCSNM